MYGDFTDACDVRLFIGYVYVCEIRVMYVNYMGCKWWILSPGS